MPVAAKHFYDDDPGYDDEYYSAAADDDTPWSQGCHGAPWWIDFGIEKEWEGYLEGLLELSSCTPDAAALNTHDDQLLFVYGTMKRGFQCHGLVADGEFVARGWTKPQAFKLVQTDTFPAAIMGASGPLYKQIAGEVYLVPTTEIKHIDQYENNGTLFHRRRIGIDLDNGGSLLAWMYLADTKTFGGNTKLCPTFTRKKNGIEYYSYTKGKPKT